MNGIKYQPNAVAMTEVLDDFPLFIKVLHLYVIDNSKLLMYGHLYKTISFDHHHHSYIVKLTGTHKLLDLEEVNEYHHQLYHMR